MIHFIKEFCVSTSRHFQCMISQCWSSHRQSVLYAIFYLNNCVRTPHHLQCMIFQSWWAPTGSKFVYDFWFHQLLLHQSAMLLKPKQHHTIIQCQIRVVLVQNAESLDYEIHLVCVTAGLLIMHIIAANVIFTYGKRKIEWHVCECARTFFFDVRKRAWAKYFNLIYSSDTLSLLLYWQYNQLAQFDRLELF